FTSRSLTLAKLEAVSRMCVTMSRGRPSTDSRWISSPFLFSWGLRLESILLSVGLDLEAELAAVVARQFQRLGFWQRNARRGEVGMDRQLAPAAVDQHCELHLGRAAVVEQFVKHGADRAPGVQHVIEQHDVSIVDVE